MEASALITIKCTFRASRAPLRGLQVAIRCPLSANLRHEAPFLLRELSYMRELPPKRAKNVMCELAAWIVAAVSDLGIAI